MLGREADVEGVYSRQPLTQLQATLASTRRSDDCTADSCSKKAKRNPDGEWCRLPGYPFWLDAVAEKSKLFTGGAVRMLCACRRSGFMDLSEARAITANGKWTEGKMVNA